MQLTWNKELSIGDERVDLIHQMNLELMNEMSAAVHVEASKERCLSLFGEFLQFLRFHYLAEENLMLDVHYGDASVHKTSHTIFLDRVKSLLTSFSNDEINAKAVLEK